MATSEIITKNFLISVRSEWKRLLIAIEVAANDETPTSHKGQFLRVLAEPKKDIAKFMQKRKKANGARLAVYCHQYS